MTDRILVVDDDPDQCLAYTCALEAAGFVVESTTDPTTALALASRTPFQLVLTDLEMPTLSGIELCTRLASACPEVAIVVATGQATLDNVASAFRAGAYDYLCKPIDPRLLTLRVTRALGQSDLRRALARAERTGNDPTSSLVPAAGSRMRAVRKLLPQVASSEASLLLLGESGTGKDTFARTVHAQGTRAGAPFVAVNCAAIPAALFESELFGHVRGAFTDAKEERAGLFVEAHGGTLFLDEIAELPLSMQTKLLRVLQERRVRPVGANQEVEVDVRLIAATHRDLDRAVVEGRFRQDLLYRIQVIRVEIPPLRGHSDDILELSVRFLAHAAERSGRAPKRLTLDAAEALCRHPFPGNVRELENAMERAEAVGWYGRVLVQDLPEAMHPDRGDAKFVDSILTVQELQHRHVVRVMTSVQGNKSRAARLLRVDRRTLQKMAERVGADTD